MSYVPIEDFPALPGEPWHELVARHREAMRGMVAPRGPRRQGFKIPRRGGYHPGLARAEVVRRRGFDPRAYVESDEQLARVVDQRRREVDGDVVTPAQLWDAAQKRERDTIEDMDRDLLAESLEETLRGPEVPEDVDLDDHFGDHFGEGEA